jgi:hypothetical protein
MPGVIEAVTFLVISAQAGALGAGLTAVFGTSTFLTTAISAGFSVLSSVLFRPKQPRPEDVQTTSKNPTSPRQRHYGRVKTSGALAFKEGHRGTLHVVIALSTGEIDEIEEFWADDRNLTLGTGGQVDQDPYDGNLFIEYRLGLPTETHYSNLTAVFPEWTSDHRGDGIASLYALQDSTPQDKLSKRFPKVSETLYRVVARGSKVFNLNPNSPPDSPPIDVWTDNAAGVIRDYMTHRDGMRLPLSLFTTTQATAGWQLAYSKCAELIPLKAGGTEPRYRLWGSYSFDERPADVLGRMLACSDGRIVPTPDGGITLEIGDWEEPTVIIDADTITGFSDVKRGRDILTTANTIRATFLSSRHDYQATDADPWIDADDVLNRGEIPLDTPFNMAPSHAQARRLMKLSAYRANPNWVGTFQCNLKALAAFGKRFVRVTYPLFEIDEVFEVTDFRFNIGEGNILIGVTLQVQSMPEEAYQWDGVTEEGTEPLAEEIVVDDTIPEPENVTFTEQIITVSGQNVSVGLVAFDLPPSASLRVEGRYKKTSDTAWLVIPIGDGETEGQTSALEDGVEYEAQVRHVTITGRVGDWTDSETLTPIANPGTPSTPTLFSATPAGSNVDLSAKAPNSAVHRALRFWRADEATAFGSAADLGPLYGPPNGVQTDEDTPGDGSWQYWATAENLSGVRSSPTAPAVVRIGLETETVAYLDAMSAKPAQSVVLAIDTLIAGLKADGVYSKLRWLSLFCLPTSQAALLNLVNPAETGTIYGTVTFTANAGFTGDGSTGYIGTGVMANAAGVFSTNSLHMGGWFNSGSGTSVNTTGIVGSSANTLFVSARANSTTMGSRANATVTLTSTISPTSLAGHRVANRSGASAREHYNNGASIGSDTQAASTLTAVELWFLRTSGGYTAAAQPLSLAHFGGSLSGAEHTALNSRLATFRTAMGL